MKYLVLGIGYSKQEYDIERNEWKKYGEALINSSHSMQFLI